MKLYVISYGNGWNGSRSNIGTAYVIADSVKEAKEKLQKKRNIKLSHMGPTKELKVVA